MFCGGRIYGSLGIASIDWKSMLSASQTNIRPFGSVETE